MKKLVSLLLISGVLFVSNSFAETVYINGKPVDQKVIDQVMNQFKKSSPMAATQANNPQFKKQILQSIGMQQAIIMEGDKLKLDQTQEYVERLQQVKPMIYAQILQERSTTNVSDAQLLARYNKMKADADKQQQYKVEHILVKDEKTANDVVAQLKKGANFAALAKKYSMDPGSKARGGDLGWSDGSNYVPEFTNAVKKLKKGQYTTTPVKSQFGYHVIMLVDTKKGPVTPFAPFDKMKERLRQEVQMENSRKVFDDIKAKYKVEVK